MSPVTDHSPDWVSLAVLAVFATLLLVIAFGVVRFDRAMIALNPLLRGRRHDLTATQNRIVRIWAAVSAALAVVYLLSIAVQALLRRD